MNHDEVTVCDAINAIILLEVSYDSNPSFLPDNMNLLHTSFPLNPMEEYRYVLDNTRKYPLRGYILGVLTHTTALDRLRGSDETLTMWF